MRIGRVSEGSASCNYGSPVKETGKRCACQRGQEMGLALGSGTLMFAAANNSRCACTQLLCLIDILR